MRASLLFAVFAATAPRFLDPTNLLNVLKHASVLALFALGVTLALVTAELDLSFANVASLAAVVTGYLVHKGLSGAARGRVRASASASSAASSTGCW